MPHISTLDELYSAVSVADWRGVLGDGLHYHFGDFEAEDEPLEVGVSRVVRALYPFIPSGCSVLDAGCGWGSTLRMLSDERSCRAAGVTISRGQYSHCLERGLSVELADLESMAAPSQHFDVVLMIESLEHISAKSALLKTLRKVGDTLIVRINCCRDLRMAAGHQPTAWHLQLETPETIQRRLERAGWRIRQVSEHRSASMLTQAHWAQHLEDSFGSGPYPGQLALLHRLCEHSLREPERWAAAHPLLQIVAD